MKTLKTRKCIHEGTKEDAGERGKDRLRANCRLGPFALLSARGGVGNQTKLTIGRGVRRCGDRVRIGLVTDDEVSRARCSQATSGRTLS